ncbi:MAG: hypothetical protein NVSMB31_07580 [Vulcanimicrobiaceae bacterium]
MTKAFRLVCVVGLMMTAACTSAQQKSAQEVASAAPAQAQDALIAGSVKAKLATVDVDSTTAIHVDVQSGHVTLSGEARDDGKRRAFAQAAQSVNGVTGVTDNLKINAKLRGARESLGDAALATRVMGALAAQAGVNALTVKATAHDGAVVLTGTAPTQAIKSTLLETARNVNGVASLTDHVTLKTP